jgi:hypothetical protein
VDCETAYYYRIRAHRSGDNQMSGYSNITSTITQACSPANAAPMPNYVMTTTPTLSWNPLSWATGYQIQINNSLLFDGTYNHSAQTAATELSIITPSLPARTYYWRVRARINATTWGSWSVPQSFAVITP